MALLWNLLADAKENLALEEAGSWVSRAVANVVSAISSNGTGTTTLKSGMDGILPSSSPSSSSFSSSVYASYHHYVHELGDPRVERWPLMRSPWPTLATAAVYVLLCRRPPKWFRGSDAAVKPWLILYNAVNVVLNAHIARELFLSSRDYNLSCQPVDYSESPTALRAASALWGYYALKGLELLDSAFFALRGKYSHLTFLHVYHHSTMFCLWWIGVKYVAGGSAVFGAFINCLVHVAMYTYYTLAALGVDRRHLWWKRHLTLLQITQFVAAIVMGLNGIRLGCDFPMWMQYAMIAYMVSFLVLFGDFFAKSYLSKGKKEAEGKAK